MTCNTELTRRYSHRAEAERYLASRGFLCLPSGWQNGRWAATLEKAGTSFILRIWLRSVVAA